MILSCLFLFLCNDTEVLTINSQTVSPGRTVATTLNFSAMEREGEGHSHLRQGREGGRERE